MKTIQITLQEQWAAMKQRIDPLKDVQAISREIRTMGEWDCRYQRKLATSNDGSLAGQQTGLQDEDQEAADRPGDWRGTSRKLNMHDQWFLYYFSPIFILSFPCGVFRCRGAGTKLASIIWPLLAINLFSSI